MCDTWALSLLREGFAWDPQTFGSDPRKDRGSAQSQSFRLVRAAAGVFDSTIPLISRGNVVTFSTLGKKRFF